MNIVVDPSHMIPGGSHFLNPFRALNALDYLYNHTGNDSVPHLKSRDQPDPMHYYLIDFGQSIHFLSFEAGATGEVGNIRHDSVRPI